MVNNACNTAWYRLVTLHQRLGIEYSAEPNTTLNEKLDILPNISIGDKYPVLKYLGVGIGGNEVLYDIMKTSEHEHEHGSLFMPVPFLIIEKSRDLTVAERKNYRLRKETIINNVEYVEYYLKTFNNVSKPEMFEVIKTGDITTRLVPFDYNKTSILNPVPRLKSDFMNEDINSYTAVTANISFYLSLTELANLKAAIALKYGADTPAIISELAVLQGVDYTTVNGTEALSVQPAFFQTVQYDLESMLFSSSILMKDIQIGGTEVLK